MKKRLVSVLLTLCMVLSLLMPVYAADESQTITLDSGTYTLDADGTPIRIDGPAETGESDPAETAEPAPEATAAPEPEPAAAPEPTDAPDAAAPGDADADAFFEEEDISRPEYDAPVSEAYAMLYLCGDGTYELVFQRGDAADARVGTLVAALTGFENEATTPWRDVIGGVDYMPLINRITFKDTVAPTSCANWFYGLSAVTEISGITPYLDTRAVTNMSGMFRGCENLKSLDLRGFDTTQVTTMQYMFSGCQNLDELDLSSFRTPSLAGNGMAYIFQKCGTANINLDLSGFDTSMYTSLAYAFNGFGGATLDVSSFDTSRVINLFGAFYSLANITGTLSLPLDTAEVTNFGRAFGDSPMKVVDVSTWDTTKATSMSDLPINLQQLEVLYVSEKFVPISSNIKSTSNVYPQKLSGSYTATNIDPATGETISWPKLTLKSDGVPTAVLYADGLLQFQLGSAPQHGDTEILQSWTGFEQTPLTGDWTPVKELDALGQTEPNKMWLEYAEQITAVQFACAITPRNPSHWFDSCQNLTTISGMENLHMDHATAANAMFQGCAALQALDVSGFDTAAVEAFESMFAGCARVAALDLSQFSIGALAAGNPNLHGMFAGCAALQTLDLSSFQPAKVEDLSDLFAGCTQLETAQLGSFDTRNVQTMANMFSGCASLKELTLDSFAPAVVTDMSHMFDGCTRLAAIYATPSFVMPKLTNSEGMFAGCAALPGWRADAVDAAKATVAAGGYLTPTDNTAWAILYKDGQLVFQRGSKLDARRELYAEGSLWTGFETTPLTEGGLWLAYADQITSVQFLDAIRPTSTAHWFRDCSQLTEIRNLEFLDTLLVTDMQHMFDGCASLTGLSLGGFHTMNVTDMSYLFANCAALPSLNLSSFNTDKVTNMRNMFAGLNVTALDLSFAAGTEALPTVFATGKVTDMTEMFADCAKLTTIQIGQAFTTDAVTASSNMFRGCVSLEGAIPFSPAQTDKTQANGAGYLTLPAYALLYKTEVVDGVQYFELDFQRGDAPDPARADQFVLAMANAEKTMPWRSKQLVDSVSTDLLPLIQKVTFRDVITPVSCLSFFDGMTAMTSIEGLDKLDVHLVVSMYRMFCNCSSLTSLNLSRASNPLWDSSKVTTMSQMFDGCTSLTSLQLDALDTSSVTNMSYMFRGVGAAAYADTDKTQWTQWTLDVSSFDTSNLSSVSTLSYIFDQCGASTIDVTGWDTSRVTVFSGLFRNAKNLSELIGYEDWDVSRVENWYFIFASTAIPSLDLSRWKFKQSTNMYNTTAAFREMSAKPTITLPADQYDALIAVFGKPSGVTYKKGPDLGLCAVLYETGTAGAYELVFQVGSTPLEGKTCVTKDGQSVYWTGFETTPLTGDWTTDEDLAALGLTERDGMWLDYKDSITSVVFHDKVSPLNTAHWFDGCTRLQSVTVTGADGKLNLYTNQTADMSCMFRNCTALSTLDAGLLDTRTVTNMSCLFQNCASLTGLDLTSWETALVTDMSHMFDGCSGLTALQISSVKEADGTVTTKTKFNTATVTTMAAMFKNCAKLTALDVSCLNTAITADMSELFSGCAKLAELDVTGFNTTGAVTMKEMFRGCAALTSLTLNSFSTGKVTDMSGMFQNDAALTEIFVSAGFDTSKVTSSADMFTGCTGLTGSTETDVAGAVIGKRFAAPAVTISGFILDASTPYYYNAQTKDGVTTAAFISAEPTVDGRSYNAKWSFDTAAHTGTLELNDVQANEIVLTVPATIVVSGSGNSVGMSASGSAPIRSEEMLTIQGEEAGTRAARLRLAGSTSVAYDYGVLAENANASLTIRDLTLSVNNCYNAFLARTPDNGHGAASAIIENVALSSGSGNQFVSSFSTSPFADAAEGDAASITIRNSSITHTGPQSLFATTDQTAGYDESLTISGSTVTASNFTLRGGIQMLGAHSNTLTIDDGSKVYLTPKDAATFNSPVLEIGDSDSTGFTSVTITAGCSLSVAGGQVSPVQLKNNGDAAVTLSAKDSDISVAASSETDSAISVQSTNAGNAVDLTRSTLSVASPAGAISSSAGSEAADQMIKSTGSTVTTIAAAGVTLDSLKTAVTVPAGAAVTIETSDESGATTSVSVKSEDAPLSLKGTDISASRGASVAMTTTDAAGSTTETVFTADTYGAEVNASGEVSGINTKEPVAVSTSNTDGVTTKTEFYTTDSSTSTETGLKVDTGKTVTITSVDTAGAVTETSFTATEDSTVGVGTIAKTDADGNVTDTSSAEENLKATGEVTTTKISVTTTTDESGNTVTSTETSTTKVALGDGESTSVSSSGSVTVPANTEVKTETSQTTNTTDANGDPVGEPVTTPTTSSSITSDKPLTLDTTSGSVVTEPGATVDVTKTDEEGNGKKVTITMSEDSGSTSLGLTESETVVPDNSTVTVTDVKNNVPDTENQKTTEITTGGVINTDTASTTEDLTVETISTEKQTGTAAVVRPDGSATGANLTYSYEGSFLADVGGKKPEDIRMQATKYVSAEVPNANVQKATLSAAGVYALSMSVSGTAKNDFGSASMTVTLPHTFADGEAVSSYKLYMISSSGKMTEVTDAVWKATSLSNALAGQYTFTTSKLGYFALLPDAIAIRGAKTSYDLSTGDSSFTFTYTTPNMLNASAVTSSNTRVARVTKTTEGSVTVDVLRAGSTTIEIVYPGADGNLATAEDNKTASFTLLVEYNKLQATANLAVQNKFITPTAKDPALTVEVIDGGISYEDLFVYAYCDGALLGEYAIEENGQVVLPDLTSGSEKKTYSFLLALSPASATSYGLSSASVTVASVTYIPAGEGIAVIDAAPDPITFDGATTAAVQFTATKGAAVTFTSSNENVVKSKTGITGTGETQTATLAIVGVGTATVTMNVGAAADAKAASATFKVVVSDKGNSGLTITKTPAAVTWGETPETFTYTGAAGAVTAVSSNTDVISNVALNNGTGTLTLGTKAGTSVITLTDAGTGTTKPSSVSFTVTVNKAEGAIDDGDAISLDMLTVGGPAKELNVTATGAVTVQSKNDNVTAVYADGKLTVTPKKYGAAMVTVTAAESDTHTAASKTYTYLVMAGAGAITVTPPDQTSIPYGSAETVTFDYTATEGLTVEVSSSNEAVATVSGKTLTVTGVGKTIITLKNTNGNYNAAPVSFIFEVTAARKPMITARLTVTNRVLTNASPDPGLAVKLSGDVGSLTDLQVTVYANGESLGAFPVSADGKVALNVPRAEGSTTYTYVLGLTETAAASYTLDSSTQSVECAAYVATTGSKTVSSETLAAAPLSLVVSPDNNYSDNGKNVSVSFDDTAAASISETAQGGDVTLTVTAVDLITNSALIDLELTDEQDNTISTFGGGKATVSMDYDSDSGKAAVFYLDEEGYMVLVDTVDCADGVVAFETTHFSTYAVTECDEKDGACLATAVRYADENKETLLAVTTTSMTDGSTITASRSSAAPNTVKITASDPSLTVYCVIYDARGQMIALQSASESGTFRGMRGGANIIVVNAAGEAQHMKITLPAC